jgi:hypothetical protein
MGPFGFEGPLAFVEHGHDASTPRQPGGSLRQGSRRLMKSRYRPDELSATFAIPTRKSGHGAVFANGFS